MGEHRRNPKAIAKARGIAVRQRPRAERYTAMVDVYPYKREHETSAPGRAEIRRTMRTFSGKSRSARIVAEIVKNRDAARDAHRARKKARWWKS